jgi:sugar/nucleoside kinase (ribokinase family)
MTLSDTFIVEKWRPELLAFVESQVDILFANEAEIMSLFQTDFDAAVAALRERVETAGVTRSEKGSVVLSGGDTVSVPADPVEKVLDTTGAGDQYAAGFLYGLASGRLPEVCGRLGSIAAAEVIAHYGPRPQVSLAELVRAAGL